MRSSMDHEGKQKLAEEIRRLRLLHGVKTGVEAARLRLDMTREQLADRLDVRLYVIDQLEDGFYPGPVLLRKLETVLGVPAEILTMI
jgi:ribosome-binding protein aMBF1 (putative translation factor)